MTNAMNKLFHTLTCDDGILRMRYYLLKKTQHSGNRKKTIDSEMAHFSFESSSALGALALIFFLLL